LRLCSLDVAQLFATVRNHSHEGPMAVPMGIAPKVVTFGGFKRCGTLFRVAGIGGPKGTQRVAPNATQSPNQRVEAKAFRFLSRRVSRRVLAGPKGTFPLDKGKGGGKEMEARDRGLLPKAKGATPAKGKGMRISGAELLPQSPKPNKCHPRWGVVHSTHHRNVDSGLDVASWI
jgi:hypothetical protein